MGDYMAQKADNQIEGGLHEQQMLYNEIESLQTQLTQERERLDDLLNKLNLFAFQASDFINFTDGDIRDTASANANMRWYMFLKEIRSRSERNI